MIVLKILVLLFVLNALRVQSKLPEESIKWVKEGHFQKGDQVYQLFNSYYQPDNDTNLKKLFPECFDHLCQFDQPVETRSDWFKLVETTEYISCQLVVEIFKQILISIDHIRSLESLSQMDFGFDQMLIQMGRYENLNFEKNLPVEWKYLRRISRSLIQKTAWTDLRKISCQRQIFRTLHSLLKGIPAFESLLEQDGWDF